MRNKENYRQWHFINYRENIKPLRIKWLKEHGPCATCGSWEKLEVHHVIPKNKISHNVWSWSEERRTKELLKCQVLCHKCHKEETKKYVSALFAGIPKMEIRKISDKDIKKAIELRKSGMSVRKIAPLFGISHNRLAELTSRYKPGMTRG